MIEIELPDGTIAEFPEGTPQDVIRGALQKRFGGPAAAPPPPDPRNSMMGKVDAFGRGAADMLSFGFADELAAGGDALLNPIFGTGQNGESFSDRYNANLGQERATDAADSEGRFSYRLGGQFAGGVTGGVGLAKSGLSMGANAANRGASLGKVSFASAGEGGLLGMGQGFGSGKDGLVERGISGLKGAAVGGLLGGAVPLAVAGASGVSKPIVAGIASRFKPAKYADNALETALSRSGKSKEEIAQALREAMLDGQDMFTVADAMGNSGQRMLSTVARNPHNERQGLVEALQSRQVGQGDRLSNFLSEGFGAPDTAMQRAGTLTSARNAAADVNYGAARNSAGAVDPTAAIQAADDFLTPGASRLMSPASNMAEDSIESAVNRARSYLTDGNSVLSDFNAALRSKQEIDAMIEGAKPAVQRQLIPIRNALDDALAKASAPYAGARDTFRQQSKAIEAIDTGKNAASGRMRSDDTISQFSAMSPDEQSAFRAGYVDPLIGRVEATSMSPTTNKARGLITPKTGAEFPAFAVPGKADQMGSRIAREQRMFETTSTALGGSKTADNLADAADLAKFDPAVMSKLMRGDVVGAIMDGISKAKNQVTGMTPPVIERLSKSLMETNPENALKILNSSAAQKAASAKQRDMIRSLIIGTGSGGTPRILGQKKRKSLEITVGRSKG